MGIILRSDQKVWDSAGDPVVKTLHFQCRGCRFDSLVRELRSHKQNGAVKKNKQATENKQIDIQHYQKKEI